MEWYPSAFPTRRQRVPKNVPQSRREFLAVCAGTIASLSGCLFDGGDETPNENTTTTPTTPVPYPSASFKTEYRPVDRVTEVIHGGGDPIEVSRLSVDGATLQTGDVGEEWEPAERLPISGVSQGIRFVLNWTADGRRQTLVEFTAPNTPPITFEYEYNPDMYGLTITHAGGNVVETQRLKFTGRPEVYDQHDDIMWREGESIVVRWPDPREAFQVMWITDMGEEIPIDTTVLMHGTSFSAEYDADLERMSVTLEEGSPIDMNRLSFESDTGVSTNFDNRGQWQPGQTLEFDDVLPIESVYIVYTDSKDVSARIESFNAAEL